jgi:ribosomal protein L32
MDSINSLPGGVNIIGNILKVAGGAGIAANRIAQEQLRKEMALSQAKECANTRDNCRNCGATPTREYSCKYCGTRY